MERLIESVQKFPCLWNTNIDEYKLYDLKDAAWTEVVKQCDLPDVKEAKNLWRKLRDGHRQAIARKKSGQAVNLKCLWKYEKQMEFLLPAMRNRTKINNYETQEDNQGNNDETQQNDDPFESVEQQNSDTFYIQPKKITVLSPSKKEQNRRKVRAARRDEVRRQTVGKSPTQDTALENFFTSMLLSTSQLPERLQLRVQRQIFNNVMDAKEEILLSQPSTSFASPSTTQAHNLLIQPITPVALYSPHSYSSSSDQEMHTPSPKFNPLSHDNSNISEQNYLPQDVSVNYSDMDRKSPQLEVKRPRQS